MHLDDVTYDFDTDRWVAQRLIKARWNDRELPPPLEPPKGGLWIRRSARYHLRESLYGPIGFAAISSSAALVYALSTGFSWLALVSAAMLWIGVPLALCLVTRPIRLAATANDLRLLEDPEDWDTCLVEIAIFRSGECVGADRGVVRERATPVQRGEDLVRDWRR